MKAIVVYKSKTGFTKKYAEWIAEGLSCKAIPLEHIMEVDLSVYGTLVFGGGLFAGKVMGLKEFSENLISFKGRKALFITGATPTGAPEVAQLLKDFSGSEEYGSLGAFYMQGGLDYAHMGVIHKGMMKMMCAIMKKEKGADSVEYKTISKSFDATDKAAILPLVDFMLQ